jgi:uncharacterized protein (TIRG00374 family)
LAEARPGRRLLRTEPETRTIIGTGDTILGGDVPRVERSKIQNAALIFVLGSVAIIGITLAMTTGEETWHGVARFGGWLLALLLVLEFLRMVLEAFGLFILVNGTQDRKITLIEALELTLEGYFIGQLIPVSAASVPYQGFLLTRKGVRAGWATALVLVKGFVPSVFFFLVLVGTIIVAALGWKGSAASLTFLRVVGPLSAFPICFVISVLVIMLKFPKLFDRLVDRIAAFLARRLRGRATERVEQLRIEMENESHIFREALTTLGRRKRWVLAWGAIFVVLAYIVEFMIGFTILWGFGYRGSLMGPLILQCLLKPILSASPTPGSLAVGEGGYIGFFAAYLPSHFIGIALVMWRTTLYFLPMWVGGLLVAKRIRFAGRDRAKDDPGDSRE